MFQGYSVHAPSQFVQRHPPDLSSIDVSSFIYPKMKTNQDSPFPDSLKFFPLCLFHSFFQSAFLCVLRKKFKAILPYMYINSVQ